MFLCTLLFCFCPWIPVISAIHPLLIEFFLWTPLICCFPWIQVPVVYTIHLLLLQNAFYVHHCSVLYLNTCYMHHLSVATTECFLWTPLICCCPWMHVICTIHLLLPHNAFYVHHCSGFAPECLLYAPISTCCHWMLFMYNIVLLLPL